MHAWTAAHKLNGQIAIAKPGAQRGWVARPYLDKRKSTEVIVACFANPILPLIYTQVSVLIGDVERQRQIIGPHHSPKLPVVVPGQCSGTTT
jgi:hypothetical protein